MGLKATNEQIIAAYRDTGSVWAAGKRLGMCGQCSHCDRPIRRVRWCLVYGPNPAQKRVPVCSKCKKMLGVYA